MAQTWTETNVVFKSETGEVIITIGQLEPKQMLYLNTSNPFIVAVIRYSWTETNVVFKWIWKQRKKYNEWLEPKQMLYLNSSGVQVSKSVRVLEPKQMLYLN